jgi:uncharacterized MAPEG superfamily protein
MTADLTYLVWAVALTLVQLVVVIAGATTQFPMTALVGNREPRLEPRGWVGRAERAHRNMLESLLPFAALVITAAVVGRSNETSALGAALFFYARLAYAIVYVIGIPWLRTLLWAVASVGTLLVLLQLF